MDLEVLADGSFVTGATVEILRVPRIEEERGGDIGSPPPLLPEFSALLGEIYQVFDWYHNDVESICVEAAWMSRPVEDQPLGAEIRLMIVVRVLGPDEVTVATVRQHAVRLIGTAVGSMGYDYAIQPFQSYAMARFESSDETLLSVSKRGEWAQLQVGALPDVYSFDVLPPPGRHMGRLASALAEMPGCAVLVQLLPTSLTNEESHAVGSTATVLSTLEGGVADPVMGQISVQTATRAARTYEHLEHSKYGTLFEYNLLVQGRSEDAPILASRLHGHMLGDGDPASLRTEVDPLTIYLDVSPTGILTEPWRIRAEIMAGRKERENRVHALQRLPSLVTAGEAAVLFRLPVLDENVGAGFEEAHLSRVRRNYSAGVIGRADVVLGAMRTPGRQVEIGLSLDDLTKHIFVAGTPGSGKTNFTIGLVHSLWRDWGIPSLIIEPAKSEYRALLRVIPDLQVFTPGNTALSPFVLNPFSPPSGVPLERHKHALTTAFQAGVTMAPPLNQIFADSVDLAYAQAGWFDHQTTTDNGAVISISELIAAFRAVFADVGYVGEAGNIGRAGVVRLRSLHRFFDTYRSIPVEQLLARPTVIELSALENAGDKALFIALIFLNVMTYASANLSVDSSRLRNVIVLEEAHVLLDAASRQGGEGESDAVGIAQDLMRRMLAEIRSSGIGLLIADQSPRAVGEDVLALTNTKIAFRLVEAGDREMLGASVGMSDRQVKRLGTLRTGEATVFFDRLESPEEVVTANYRESNGIPITITDDEVRRLNSFWTANQELLSPYPECEFVSWNPAMAAVARQIGKLAYRSLPGPPFSRDLLYRGVRQAVSDSQHNFPDEAALPAMSVLCFLRMVRFEADQPLSQQTLARTLRSVSVDRGEG